MKQQIARQLEHEQRLAAKEKRLNDNVSDNTKDDCKSRKASIRDRPS